MEINERPTVRLTPYDKEVVRRIAEKNPHIPDLTGLLRISLRQWDIENGDPNSKGKRLERIETELREVKQLINYLIQQNKLDSQK